MALAPTYGTKRRTMSIEEAGRQLGLSRNSAYQAAGRGEIPTIKIGRRLLVPIVALDRLIDAAAHVPQRDA